MIRGAADSLSGNNPNYENFSSSQERRKTVSTWMRSVTHSSERVGKLGSREQIVVEQSQLDVNIKVQIIKQGAFARLASTLMQPLGLSFGKRVISEVHVFQSQQFPFLDSQGNIDIKNVKNYLDFRRIEFKELIRKANDLETRMLDYNRGGSLITSDLDEGEKLNKIQAFNKLHLSLKQLQEKISSYSKRNLSDNLVELTNALDEIEVNFENNYERHLR